MLRAAAAPVVAAAVALRPKQIKRVTAQMQRRHGVTSAPAAVACPATCPAARRWRRSAQPGAAEQGREP